jgi:hypothetical protein
MEINTMLKNILIISLLTVSLFACTNDESSKIKGDFLAGCVSSGASKSVCKCIYSKLQEKYTDEELIRINSSRSLTEDFVNDSVNAAQECRN